MALQRVRRRSASDAVYEQLLETLLAGEMVPGESLPAERTLTDLLGVNRQAVREALQRLSEAGLIEIRQGGATRVRDFRKSASLDLLPHLLVRGDGPEPAVVRSVMEMRAALGVDVARMCARRAGPALVSDIGAVVDRMRAAEELAGLAELGLEFWDLLVEGSDNIAYRLAFNSLRRTYEPLAPLLADVLVEELSDIDGHGAVAARVGEGDESGAAEAARSVLAKGTAAVAQALAGRGD